MLRSEGLGWVIGVADTEVAVLAEDDETLGLLSDRLSHETGVVVEAVNVTLITSVEQDRASGRIPVSLIH